MVWGSRADELDAAGQTYIAPPKPEPKFSAWGIATALPRGVGEAGAQVMGTAADLAGAWKTLRDTPHEKLKGAGLPVEAYSSEFGDSLRDRGREFRPDPATAHAAEQVLYGFARGATKVIGGAVLGGIPGVVVAGAEEAFSTSDDLRRQGVDANTRANAGAVQGAGLALAALPAAGTTLAGTLGLYLAGGPGGFIAQQALTREILKDAGYERLGMGYDPFDPVGLAVSSLIPAGFAAYGLRQNKMAAAVKSLPDLPRDAAPAPDAPTAPPSDLTPVAMAVRGYSDDVVDAARVSLLAERRAAANVGADDLRSGDMHEAALSRAEQQIAAGERVEVGDVAPGLRADMAEDSPFATWEGQLRGAAEDMQKVADSERRAEARAAKQAEPVEPAPRQPPAKTAAGESATPAAGAETSAMPARFQSVAAQYPDLTVLLDGMDKPQRLSDFLAAVKAEADEIEADAPLMQLAAECAITFGA